MISAEATIKGNNQLSFPGPLTGSHQANPKAKARHAGSVRHTIARELNLSGSQLVVGCACFLGAANLLLWALLKLWLFEP